MSTRGLCLNVSYSELSHQVWFTGEGQIVGHFEHPPSLLPVNLRLVGREVVHLASGWSTALQSPEIQMSLTPVVLCHKHTAHLLPFAVSLWHKGVYYNRFFPCMEATQHAITTH